MNKSVWRQMTLYAIVSFAAVSCTRLDDSQAVTDLESAKILIAEAESSILADSANEQYYESVQLLTSAIDSGELPDEKYVEALAVRANAQQSLGLVESAISDLDEAIARDPQNPGYYFHRSTLYQSSGHFDGAITDLTRVIELSDSFTLAYRSRAAALYTLGYYDRALEDLTVAIEHDQNDIGSISRRGDAYFSLSRFDEAISDYRKSLELVAELHREIFEGATVDGYNPEEEEILLKIGKSFEEMERLVDAADIYEQIIARNPENREAQERLDLLKQ